MQISGRIGFNQHGVLLGENDKGKEGQGIQRHMEKSIVAMDHGI